MRAALLSAAQSASRSFIALPRRGFAAPPPPRGSKAVAAPPKKRPVMKPLPTDPLFRDLWRRFQLRVHPDLFANFPVLQAANSAALQKLQGILNEVRTTERSTDEMLRPRVETVELYLRSKEDPDSSALPTFLRVPVTIRLSGAHSHHALADAMATLFKHAGLPTRFRWGEGYWMSSYTDATPPAGEEEVRRTRPPPVDAEHAPRHEAPSHDDWESFQRRGGQWG